MTLKDRTATVVAIAKEAGALAMDYYRARDTLQIDMKGSQDFVSQADRNVELLIRARLAAAFPDDAIVGEEHANTAGTSGFTWVIDPIDGTANFVSDVPFWCVAIAGVAEGRTQVGVIFDPNHDECFTAFEGGGAWLNDQPMAVRAGARLEEGTVCVGSSRRSPTVQFMHLLQMIVEPGGVFARTGSGALGLAYVAAGRYLGYIESHMNAWDCLAGQLMIAQAGGRVEAQDAEAMIRNGGRVVATAPGIFERAVEMTDTAFVVFDEPPESPGIADSVS